MEFSTKKEEEVKGKLGRGAYLPPFKFAQTLIEDKSSTEYQRLTWDALRKSINGLVNKINSGNFKNVVYELFEENLIRGRGLFCRSIIKAQKASPSFTRLFAALVAVVNTKFPEVGALVLKRTVWQLQTAYERSDRPKLLAHEIVALEWLTVLLENPTDDSVEVAVGFVTECGSLLQDLSPKALAGIFEFFRGILYKGEIHNRVMFLIEDLFAIRKAKFKGYPAVRSELYLVDQEDKVTHEISVVDKINDPETSLDIFKADSRFLENEKRFEEIKRNILGNKSSSKGEAEDLEDEESDEEEDEKMDVHDETETERVNFAACNLSDDHVMRQLRGNWAQTIADYAARARDGIMHHAPGVLQSRADISSLLWSLGAAFMHDQQNPPAKL
ncbi:hypothetical protein IFM89_003113 [Coptis chinensis]|uniref:MIF4G domain-containing protein n=1 Tax=Coptis chinensis TaxID=261450 RepID=A0A835MBH2_9MAGN|nr:hypothetical protein IFM89_003113 [Coptis chinensis]